MASGANNPKLKLEFSGEAFAAGRVPLTVVAAKLQALQTLLYHAAAAISSDSSSRRGQWFNKYREVAELSFASAHHSDLVIEAELSPTPVLGDAFDTGKQAVDLVFTVGASINAGQLPNGTISKDDRRYLLRAFEGLMPNTTDQYQVVLENGRVAAHPKLTFTPEKRKVVRRLVAPVSAGLRAEATLVGELIKIHLDAGEDKITLRSDSREIDCFYPESHRDQNANLMAGSLIEVFGEATLDERDQVLKLNQVIGIDTVSLEPLRMNRFEHAGRRYDLKQPVVVQVTYDDGLWEYFNDALNVRGYAERREDALSLLHESFDYAFREFAQEQDAVLSAGALQLKQSLLGVVQASSQGIR
jgi:hypothetical protein